MRRDYLKVLKSINLSSTESQDSKACLQALENYFKPANNEVYERFKFYTCDQGPNELVEQWLTRLRHLSSSCNFGATLDSMLRDRLILGTKDEKAHLFREKNVDLNIAINCFRTSELAGQRYKLPTTSELAGQQLREINSTTCEDVNFSKRKDKQGDKKDNQASRDISCKFCNKKHEFGKKFCPAWGKECKSCKIKNHFEGSLVCKESKK